MSEFKFCRTQIREINPHTNADALEIATIYGFQTVVKKDMYRVGDMVWYLPIDSVIPEDLETILFPADAKIKLHNRRVRQIRIRQFPSQGMIIQEADILKLLELRGEKVPQFSIEQDYKEKFGIIKYEPPEPEFQKVQGQKRDKPLTNPLFHGYNGLENIKWFPDLFTEGEKVIIQEKLHGSSARASILPTSANTTWKKILKFFGLLPEYEFCYGSNNVELTNRKNFKGFYGTDIYGAVLQKVGAREKIKENETIYGELIGAGVQKHYDYGHKDHHFVLFDVKIMNPDGTFVWLTPDEVEVYAKERDFDMVPILYKGVWDKEKAHELTKGNSVYCPAQKIREGVVVKSADNYNDPYCSSQKRALKMISENYLDKDNSDFH